MNKIVNDLNKEELLEKMKPLDKLDEVLLAKEDFSLKPYFETLSLTEARIKFRIRTYMVKTVKMNFPSDPIYTRELWECNECPQIDTQSHILMTCPGYQHLRVNKNFDNDHDLVKFFQQVIDLRESVDK